MSKITFFLLSRQHGFISACDKMEHPPWREAVYPPLRLQGDSCPQTDEQLRSRRTHGAHSLQSWLLPPHKGKLRAGVNILGDNIAAIIKSKNIWRALIVLRYCTHCPPFAFLFISPYSCCASSSKRLSCSVEGSGLRVCSSSMKSATTLGKNAVQRSIYHQLYSVWEV